MTSEELLLRRAMVMASALVYWGGVWVQARRVRKRIGRSPNVKPRGSKEKLLWAGWMMVVVVWLVQPLLIGRDWPGLKIAANGLGMAGLVLGVLLVLAGYAGTLWCYAAMGSAWRMGINRKEKNSLVTEGPYRSVRHPIYLFQIVMLAGVLLLLPTALSLVALVLHAGCVLIKANDEETYLRSVHGEEYSGYLARTGMLWPRL